MRLEATSRWRDGQIELFLLEPALVSPAYVGWLNDAQINQFLESRFATHDIESTRQFVQHALEDPAVLFLGIHSREVGAHVGNIKLGPIDRHHGLAEVGIMIGERAAWGKGIATAAIVRLAEIAKAELGLRKITAGCYGSNGGSARAFEKAGFAIEGRRSAHYLLNGQPEDHVLLARFL